jgi:hypothetical protein
VTAKSHPSLRSVAVLLVAGVALAGAGCGRKADPELPSVQKAAPSASPMGIPVGRPTTPEPTKVEHKPFALDFLL